MFVHLEFRRAISHSLMLQCFYPPRTCARGPACAPLVLPFISHPSSLIVHLSFPILPVVSNLSKGAFAQTDVRRERESKAAIRRAQRLKKATSEATEREKRRGLRRHAEAQQQFDESAPTTQKQRKAVVVARGRLGLFAAHWAKSACLGSL